MQIFKFPDNFDIAKAVQSSLKQEIDSTDRYDSINTSIKDTFESKVFGDWKISFTPKIKKNSTGLSLGYFQVTDTKNQKTLIINLSCEEYNNGTKSLSLSCPEDINAFNTSIEVEPAKSKEDIFITIAKKLFEHFKANIAISFCDEDPGYRINNTASCVERLETSPFSIIQAPETDISSENITRDPTGHYLCKNGSNPISFRNGASESYSRNMATLLQKIGFKNSTAS